MIIKPNNLNSRPTSTQGAGHDPNASKVSAQKYAQTANQAVIQGAEKVAVSEAGKSMQAAVAVIRETPDTRTAKVDRLKKEVEAGTYHVDSRKVADKIIQEFSPVKR